MNAVTGPSERRLWSAWLATFCGVGAGALAILFLFLVLIDPYDSGRFPGLGIVGVDDASPRTSNVSLGRDPQFDAAVIGNSTGQLLHPMRLSQLTSHSFVQLSVPGSHPREQLALLEWFVRRHAHVSALVLVTDLPWCTQDPSLPTEHPFPFWLYSDSDIEYLRNLFSGRSLERAFRRIGMALGWRQRIRAAGYFDYEALSRNQGRRFAPPPLPPPSEPAAAPPEPSLPFPVIDRLETLLADLTQAPPIVLVIPPTFASLVPRAGTPAAALHRSHARRPVNTQPGQLRQRAAHGRRPRTGDRGRDRIGAEAAALTRCRALDTTGVTCCDGRQLQQRGASPWLSSIPRFTPMRRTLPNVPGTACRTGRLMLPATRWRRRWTRSASTARSSSPPSPCTATTPAMRWRCRRPIPAVSPSSSRSTRTIRRWPT